MDRKIKYIIDDFIDKQIYELQEDGNLALDYCEEENDYHIMSYWITGSYAEVKQFINDNYSEELINGLLELYPYELSELEKKIAVCYSTYNKLTLAYEALASILLKEMQYYTQWTIIYGVEEQDMIDFNKYSIHTALKNPDDFPIIKSQDIVAAMYGINDMVHPSEMYDVFAHYADKLKKKDETLLSEQEDEEAIFTPDAFLVAAVVSRYKNYIDLTKKKFSDYALKYFELSSIENNNVRNYSILTYVLDDYMYRFCESPYGLPLQSKMIQGKIVEVDNQSKFLIKYRIRGIRNMKTEWDDIAEFYYAIPSSSDELKKLIINIAVDFKRELNGLEKVRNKDIAAYAGKYPNRLSASHGLTYVQDLNVHYKDKRGNDFLKPMKANFSLALAEKQSLYLIKKSLRYADVNPVVSCSFGIDSITTLSLIRKVTKNFTVIFNNSNVEYPELIKYKKQICSEWNLNNKLIETNPAESYWSIQKRVGWNFDRKGDRRNGKSNSEECCYRIKHKPMYDLVDKLFSKGNPIQVNFTGVRAQESRARSQAVKRDSVVYFSKTWKSIRVNPIAFYSNEMVWEYVDKYKIPYCEVYDKVVYYEDVYDKIDEDEYHKVYYQPRIGCMTCLLRNNYIFFLKKYYPKLYDFLMIKKGLAKDLFIRGAKKQGIISENIIVTNTESQLSLFYDIAEESAGSSTEITSEDILKYYSISDMESLIIKRPCKFLA